MELRIMGRSGDEKIFWDTSDAASLANAKEKFDGAMKRNCLAFRLNPDGTHGDRITVFDPAAERVIIIPQMAGGLH